MPAERSASGGVLAVLGVLGVGACCAGPVLIGAAVGTTVLGVALGVWVVGAAGMIAAIVALVKLRPRGRTGGGCSE
jgi:hypothetical protein